jgi:tetratricopeptide (TPR) repeat protein
VNGKGLVCLARRDYPAAAACFQAVNNRSGQGLAHLGMRNEQEALKCFSEVNDLAGQGLYWLAKKQYAKADDCFAKSYNYSGLGLSALKQKRIDEAVANFQKVNDIRGLAAVCLAIRDYEQAVQGFTQLNDQSGLGMTYMAMNQPGKARAAFLAAHDYNGLGDLHSMLYEFAQAREMFAKDNNPVKVIQSFRNDFTLPDRHQQAIAYGLKAVAAGNHVPECLMEMADIYYELGQLDQGIAALDQAASYPGYASEASLLKGRIYFYHRDFAKAEAAFLAVKPDDMAGEHRFKEAQDSLQVLALYKNKKLQPAPNF